MEYRNPNKGKFDFKRKPRPNLLNPSLTSQLVSEVLTQPIFYMESKELNRQHEALQVAKKDFELRQVPSAQVYSPKISTPPLQQPKTKNIRNPLVYEYELKREAYRSSLQNQRNYSMDGRINPIGSYNYNNDSAIYKKQAKDFNIITALPQRSHELRQHHKLSTENKLGWHLESNYQLPMPIHYVPSNPQRL